MVASNSVLERYALAFIKKSGKTNNVKDFVLFCGQENHLAWSEEKFDEIYENFVFRQSNTNFNFQQYANVSGGQQNNWNRGTQLNSADTQWSFWDCLLLQCCLNSLFSGRSNTTVNNTTNFNYGNNNHKNKTKELEDSRKLLAAGIVVAVVVIIFHVSMCYWYYNSKKMARKLDKIDYLDDKLKTFRNIESLGCAVSLVG